MSKTLKIIMILSIIISLIVFAVLGAYIKSDIDYNMKDLSNKLLIIDMKREYFTQQTVNLQSVKTNLANEIAKVSDKTQQEELQKQLISLNEQQRLAAQQREAQEQARIDALRQQQIQQAQQNVTTTVKKSTSSSSSTKTTTTPKPKPAPVKTRAS